MTAGVLRVLQRVDEEGPAKLQTSVIEIKEGDRNEHLSLAP